MASAPSLCPEHGPALVAFRYVLLIILLIYGCTLSGAADGISAFFVPRTWTGPGSIQVCARCLGRLMSSAPSSCPGHGPALVAFRYVLLIILLIYGCKLPGAADCISAFFMPRTWTGPCSIQVRAADHPADLRVHAVRGG
jgi:SNF family Na+-dependent transporter